MEDKIRAAYDAMDPTPEQEERMLAKLLAAQGEAQDTVQEGEKANVAVPISAAEVLSGAAEQAAVTAQAAPKRRTPFTAKSSDISAIIWNSKGRRSQADTI